MCISNYMEIDINKSVPRGTIKYDLYKIDF